LAVFLVERYAPRQGTNTAPDALEVGLTVERGGVRLVLSVTVPSDEIALSLFEAPTEDALRRDLDARGWPFVRIVEAFIAGPGLPGRKARATAP
jgi:hypothetical protein